MVARPRRHKQRKLNDHVYSFLLFVSSRPHYQAESYISKVAYFQRDFAVPVFPKERIDLET